MTSSHFLRNIGLGKNIAIIDRHILKNMKKYGAIKHMPVSFPPPFSRGQATAGIHDEKFGSPIKLVLECINRGAFGDDKNLSSGLFLFDSGMDEVSRG